MGLKSIHEARKIQNEPENSSDSQLIKEQMNLIGELQEQISKLSSEKSILLNELQKRSQKIISLNEQIGRLAESDLVLKRNEQLEKQNARLEREKQEAIQKADTVAQNCKAEYEQKFTEVERQKKQVEHFKKLEKKKIPDDIDYDEVNSLRLEARQKLKALRPVSIGQASRISGVSPADISVLLVYLEQRKYRQESQCK